MPVINWFEAQVLSDQIAMVGVLVGAVGLLGVFLQLRQQSLQAQTAFEDSFDERYRQVVSPIPTRALLGDELTEEEYQAAFDDLHRYIDLCNEQAFLFNKRRIRRKTWVYWLDGLSSNLDRPAFKRAWTEISTQAPNDFSELRDAIRKHRRSR
jgi:hypothetical protein